MEFRNIFTFVLLFILFNSSSKSSATIYLNQDFEVESIEDLSNWIFYGFVCSDSNGVFTCPNLVSRHHGFKLENGSLVAPNSGIKSFDRAEYPIKISFGTWSFDWRVPEDFVTYDTIEFIGNRVIRENLTSDNNLVDISPQISYSLLLETSFVGIELSLWKNYDSTENTLGRNIRLSAFLIADIKPQKVIGWHHIDITKDTNGNFKIYFDHNLELELSDPDAKTTSSTYFSWISWTDASAIDNLIIRDIIKQDNNVDNSRGFSNYIRLVIPVILILFFLIFKLKKKGVKGNKLYPCWKNDF